MINITIVINNAMITEAIINLHRSTLFIKYTLDTLLHSFQHTTYNFNINIHISLSGYSIC